VSAVEISTASQVWNRACSVECVGTGVGDRHLWSLLRVHNCVMSGGVGFADDALSAGDFEAGAAACRYLGMPDLAAVMLQIHASDPEQDDELQEAYDRLVPRDQVVADAFARRFAAAPGDFDPVQ
jgi:hypothetical protein